ncbi:hypothetical protein A1D22_05985 [Pasteurellaceae bacterium LFhippo2]|nr:hypothetical protein [Pasteurellaceae bacterium LFhippo2]
MDVYQCSAVELRQSLEMVEEFQKIRLGFIPIPYLDEEHRQELIEQMQDIIAKMTSEATE